MLVLPSGADQRQEQILRRAICLAASAFTLLWYGPSPARAQEHIPLKVLGQPRAAGPIAERIERPFFASLGQRADLPLTIDYVPLDEGGVAEADALTALTAGQAQIAALRVSLIGRQEPAFLGLDLVGLNTDYSIGRRVVEAYLPVLDKRLQERIGVKLLGAWPYGPEILFCAKPIARLSDIHGLKVRTSGAESAAFIERAGGVAVPLGFSVTRQSLTEHAVDCAIGNPSGALDSGWTEATTHVLPIAFQLGINGYGIGLPTWRRFDGAQQSKLSAAFQSLTGEMWRVSEALAQDAVRCSTGAADCSSAKRASLGYVAADAADVAFLREGLRTISYPRWAQLCDRDDVGCSARWQAVVGGLVDMPSRTSP